MSSAEKVIEALVAVKSKRFVNLAFKKPELGNVSSELNRRIEYCRPTVRPYTIALTVKETGLSLTPSTAPQSGSVQLGIISFMRIVSLDVSVTPRNAIAKF